MMLESVTVLWQPITDPTILSSILYQNNMNLQECMHKPEETRAPTDWFLTGQVIVLQSTTHETLIPRLIQEPRVKCLLSKTG